MVESEDCRLGCEKIMCVHTMSSWCECIVWIEGLEHVDLNEGMVDTWGKAKAESNSSKYDPQDENAQRQKESNAMRRDKQSRRCNERIT